MNIDRANRILLWSALLALLLVFVCKTLIWPPVGKPASVVIALLHLVPLLACLPGLLQRSQRTYLGLCFIILLYFVMAGGSLGANMPFYDIAALGLSMIIFITAMLAARWQRREVHTQESKL